ncbi:hypothetical protein ACP70R_033974 [Stipagrostis hirtigluma subsp. patula]
MRLRFCPNEAKTEQVATPSMRGDSGHSKENGCSSVNEQDVSSKATIAISSGVIQAPVGAEPIDRFLKRVQLDISDPEIPSSKRSNVGDGPQLGETSCLFHMALCCNRSENEGMIDRVKADRFLDQGSKLQDEQEATPVPAKSVNCWIGRWWHTCSSWRPRSGKAGEEVDQASEELGGQFPSITAMAMMGRAMNKLRACERQKKDPSVMWKTE